jgi:hypothetical protein
LPFILNESLQAYPEAVKIRVMLDNLKTHHARAFDETFPTAEPFELTQKFEFYYTPRRASWLNMIEIEFSAIARQCLSRRIPSRALAWSARSVGGVSKKVKKIKSK